MLVLGRLRDGSQDLLTVDPRNLLFNSAILGQSGSGKSYAMARVLEEIILKTRIRIIIIDPNGDFSRFFIAQPKSYWEAGSLAGDLKRFAEKQTRTPNYDLADTFTAGWQSHHFQLVSADQRNWTPYRPGANAAPLKLHWKWLGWEQDILLQVDPTLHPKLQLGIVACNHYCSQNRQDFPQLYSLEDLENVAHAFANRKSATGDYPHATSLTTDDWFAVALQYRQVRKRYQGLWFDGPLMGQTRAPSDLSNYLYNGFHDSDPWQACTISLAGLNSDHMQLAVDVTLMQVWQQAVDVWRSAREHEFAKLQAAQPASPIEDITSADRNDDISNPKSLTEDISSRSFQTGIVEIDQRVPTIIVIDEAHNFAPLEPASQMQRRVSDRITTIAAEGRKYGLFVLLATQRPQKLRRGLLAECENSCLMRLQSRVEQEYAANELGVPKDSLTQLAQFNTGDGLMIGRWVPGMLAMHFAPSRTVLGGGGMDEKAWLVPPHGLSVNLTATSGP